MQSLRLFSRSGLRQPPQSSILTLTCRRVRAQRRQFSTQKPLEPSQASTNASSTSATTGGNPIRTGNTNLLAYFAIGAVAIGAAGYYFREEAPLSGRQRIVFHSKKPIGTRAQEAFDNFQKQNKDSVLPAGHPSVLLVGQTITRLVEANEAELGQNWRWSVIDSSKQSISPP
jgi:hypothetical protein